MTFVRFLLVLGIAWVAAVFIDCAIDHPTRRGDKYRVPQPYQQPHHFTPPTSPNN